MRRALYYVLFNDSWDRVAGNDRDQMGRPDTAGQLQALEKYLEYLIHSLESFRRHHVAGQIPVKLLLVELTAAGLAAQDLRNFVAGRLPGFGFDIAIIGNRHVQPFVAEALAMPRELYRSPNRLHEACLFQILRAATETLVAVVDPDITFLTDDALDRIWSLLLARPEKWAASFVEVAKKQPWSGGWMVSRERMHSVAAFFKVDELRRNLPLERFTSPTPLEARLADLRNSEAVAYYRRYLVLDTFSILTEYLRGNYAEDRLLNLNECLPHFHAGQMLTLVSDWLIHAKYRDPTARPALSEALQSAGLDAVPLNPEIERLLARARD